MTRRPDQEPREVAVVELQSRIKALRSAVSDSDSNAHDRPSEFWRDVWNRIRSINRDFMDTRFQNPNERRETWGEFDQIVKTIKACQAEQIEARVTRRQEKSVQLLVEILSSLRNAWPRPDGFQEFLEHVVDDRAIVDDVMLYRRNTALSAPVVPMTGDRMGAARRRLLAYAAGMRFSWALYKSRRTTLSPAHREWALNALLESQRTIDAEWNTWRNSKEAQFSIRGQVRAQNRTDKQRLIDNATRLAQPTSPDALQRAKELISDWLKTPSAGPEADQALWLSFRTALDEFYCRDQERYREYLVARISKIHRMLIQARLSMEQSRALLDRAGAGDLTSQLHKRVDHAETRLRRFEASLVEAEEQLTKLSLMDR